MQRGTARIALAMIALVVAVSIGVVALSSSDEDDTPGATTTTATADAGPEVLDVENVNRGLLRLPDGDRTPLELARTIPDVQGRAITPEEGEELDISVDEQDDGRVVVTIVDRPLDDAIERVVYQLDLVRSPRDRYRATGLTREVTCRRGEDAQGFCL